MHSYVAPRFVAAWLTFARLLRGISQVRALALCALLLVALTGCSRAPDEDIVRSVVSERLGTAFQEPLFNITNVRRLGSAPLPTSSDGASRLIVYYNAQLTLTRDYEFSNWDALNPAALANLLGATERGVTGIKNTGNVTGDELYVRGSVTFRRDGTGEWTPMLFVPPELTGAAASNDPASMTARELAAPIMQRFASIPPSQAAASRAIIVEEMEEAMRQIDLRLDNLQHVLIVAGGPVWGEYSGVAKAIAGLGSTVGVRVAATNTEGSVENAQLLREHFATVGLVQSDVALMAFQGTGPFAGQGVAPGLRAMGSLFPEAVQIVVRADGPTSVEDLRGMRVNLGAPTSGSRITALRVLKAYGIEESDIRASTMGSVDAGHALVRGEIDAFINVISAPERHLQRLAAAHAIRILPLTTPVIDAMVKNVPGVVPITLQAGTYPGQDAPVRTIGVAALLVGNANMSNAEVRRILNGVYSTIDFVGAGSVAGAMISLRHALTGVTIPLHTGAEAYFKEVMGQDGAQPVAAGSPG